MHADVIRDEPGTCTKCGMDLVSTEGDHLPSLHDIPVEDRGLGVITWENYLPLIIIIGSIFVAALFVASVAAFTKDEVGVLFIKNLIGYFMAGFFLAFSAFKFADLRGFTEGYATYDLLAQRVYGYGYIYPFI